MIQFCLMHPPFWFSTFRSKKFIVMIHSQVQVPSIQSCPSFLTFTPLLPCHALQATLINSNHTSPCIVVPPHHIVDGGQNLGQNAPSQPQGCRHLLRSHGHHVTICATTHHPGLLIGRPPSQQTWDLRVPTSFFSIYFHLIAC